MTKSIHYILRANYIQELGECPRQKERCTCYQKTSLNCCHKPPLLAMQILDQLELYGDLACPYITHQLLDCSDILGFEKLSADQVDLGELSVKTHLISNKAYPLLDKLRQLYKSLIENKKYSFEQRLLLVSLFFSQYIKLLEMGELNGIKRLFLNYNQMVEEGKLGINLKAISIDTKFKLFFLHDLNKTLLVGHDAFDGQVTLFYRGLGCDAGAFDVDDHILREYTNAYHNYYEPFMEAHSGMLKNYLVDAFYKGGAMYFDKDRVFEEFILHVMQYVSIEVFMIGISAFYADDLCIDHFVEFLSAYHDAVGQNAEYRESVVKSVKDNNFANFPTLMLLLKNG